MNAYIFGEQEAAKTGFTHKFVLTYADFSTAGLSLAVPLIAYTAGTAITKAAYKLVTAFDGGATSTGTLIVGHNGATTDDADSLIASTVVHVDGTEVFYGLGTGAAFAANATGYVALDAGNIEATLTTVDANTSALTQGEVHVYLSVTDLTKI